MIRHILSASVASALMVANVSPAFAQSYAMADQQAPLGATATVNFKVPLGAAPAEEKKASYGLTLGYGQRLDSLTPDGRIATRQTKLADLRFSDGFKLNKAEVATFDLANLDEDQRLNMAPGKSTLPLIAIGLAVGAVLLWAAIEDDDDDDDDDFD